MDERTPKSPARDAFTRVWCNWDTLSLNDGEVLEADWLYRFGPNSYATESLDGGPGYLVWAVNDYWALTLVNAEDPGQDVDRDDWVPPGLCGLPDGYRQREVLEAANRMVRKHPARVDGVYNAGSGDFKYTQIDAVPGISVFYGTREVDSDEPPVMIEFEPDFIGPIEQNLTANR